MSKTIEMADIVRALEKVRGAPALTSNQCWDLAQALNAAAPVVKRQPTGRWCIPVNGEWFYGTHEQCVRERAEYESTFTDLDREEAGVVVPEKIWSSPPAPVDVAELLRDAYEEGYNDGQNNPNGYGNKETRDKCVAALLERKPAKNGCGSKLAPSQHFSHCGDKNPGQTNPSLCTHCGGSFVTEAP